MLPGKSGPRFVAEAALEGTRVVFMSGYAGAHVARHHLASEFMLLEKPFTRQQLLESVARVLTR